ncbi:hypothetical protein PIB30_044235 [Stylosanthes scabra]|uniref:Uncharacterized protein n=1 Tax=Stylosanthes scabra TaxID=79078 RepID=A0ABU6WFU1_9FABA|nr:hypothetical protein [Stylosanthes scabra]
MHNNSFLRGWLGFTAFPRSFVVDRDLLYFLLRIVTIYFYPSSVRFPTDGANVKVRSLNDCPIGLWMGYRASMIEVRRCAFRMSSSPALLSAMMKEVDVYESSPRNPELRLWNPKSNIGV